MQPQGEQYGERVGGTAQHLRVVPDHEAVLHNLESFGMLKREQSNRRKHRYCSGRFFGYSIHADRLLEHMNWSPEDVARLSTMHPKHTLTEDEAYIM